MAGVDWDGFLGTLAAWMAAAVPAPAGGPLAYAGTPRAVWRNQAVEADAASVNGDKIWSVLRIYAGGVDYVPVARPAIQVETVTRLRTNAFARAQALFNTLLDADGRPLRMVDLGASPSYRVLAVDLRPVTFVGFDEAQRSRVVFNFDARVVPI